ncbi:hypothetical protein ABPG72_014694 [Tetrahymena utriculariae]
MEEIRNQGFIIVLFGGKFSVGKSSIAQKYCGVEYKLAYYHNHIKKCSLNLEITQIDSLGEEINGVFFFQSYCKFLSKGGCLILVYDITDRGSFEEMIEYYFESTKIKERKFTYLILGNKLDLFDNRQVSFSEGKSFADSYGILFFEVSSLYKQNIYEAYNQLIEESIQRIAFFETYSYKKE